MHEYFCGFFMCCPFYCVDRLKSQTNKKFGFTVTVSAPLLVAGSFTYYSHSHAKRR